MSRDAIPFAVDDISALAKSLNTQLHENPEKIGHVALLNMLARGAGFRNFQHLRAAAEAEGRLSSPPVAPEPVDFVKIEKIAHFFDIDGSLRQWPGKDSQCEACLWVLWSRLKPRHVYSEKDINALLNANHQFKDHALLRRELVDRRMVTRTSDGREYRRIEAKPPQEAAALIRVLNNRKG